MRKFIVLILVSAIFVFIGCAPKVYTLSGSKTRSPVSDVALLINGKCSVAFNIPFLLEVDGMPGPNNMGLIMNNITIYNDGSSGKFTVELAPGEHTLVGAYGKSASSVVFSGAIFPWSNRPTNVKFTVSAGKTYLLMASQDRIWVEEQQ